MILRANNERLQAVQVGGLSVNKSGREVMAWALGTFEKHVFGTPNFFPLTTF